MVIVSCITKFHAFSLAEQLEKHELLSHFYTTYAFQKNTIFRRFAGREDKEEIAVSKIHTNLYLAALVKKFPKDFVRSESFDKWVASNLKKKQDYKIFIGWSGMSLNSLRVAKYAGKKTIIERGSSHILLQNEILNEEYKKFGIDFQIDKRVINKELNEYKEADYISIPSLFVKRSFIKYGIDEKKLLVNNYGASDYFINASQSNLKKSEKFIILYLGALTIQKGLIYLFQAISLLSIPESNYEVWFIGSVSDELSQTIQTYKKSNWRFWGHQPHYELKQYISQCNVAVQPSLQEGLSMVIPQILRCGIPVIASVNSGGEDIITEGVNGFIVPIRDPEAIKQKIELVYYSERNKFVNDFYPSGKNLSWDAYGNRYANTLKTLINNS